MTDCASRVHWSQVGFFPLDVSSGFIEARIQLSNRRGPTGAGGRRRRTVARRLGFFGLGRAQLVASRSINWEDDPWMRGGYAFFDSSFPPSARRLLALAGERESVCRARRDAILSNQFQNRED